MTLLDLCLLCLLIACRSCMVFLCPRGLYHALLRLQIALHLGRSVL